MIRPRNAILIVLCMAGLVSCRRSEAPWHDGTPLLGVICLDDADGGGALCCGYNYELLQRFARSSGRLAHIRLDPDGRAVLDSLRSGAVDVVAFPYKDSIQSDSTLLQVPLDSSGVWVFSSSQDVHAGKAAQWLREFVLRPDYPLFRQPFFDVYNPLKRVSADFISPYDSLFRIYADTLHWDWKLLAALVYKESKFHIEARSSRGASGLMQLLPDTAESFGCSNPLDPEENIRAGVSMLRAVEKRYKRIAANPEELTKFTLAAYNAGTGRMKDCINYARHTGTDVSRWENIASVIPQMKLDSIAALDTIKHGPFHGGRETITYVRRVRAYHERYRHICP